MSNLFLVEPEIIKTDNFKGMGMKWIINKRSYDMMNYELKMKKYNQTFKTSILTRPPQNIENPFKPFTVEAPSSVLFEIT
jgi:hypothetical protein